MKVLAAILANPFDPVGGAVNAGLAISQALADHCEVEIALMADQYQSSSLGAATLHRVDSRCTRWLPMMLVPNRARRLLFKSPIPKMIRQRDFDLVHLHNVVPGLELRAIANAAMQSRTPYVITAHGFHEVFVGSKAGYLSLLEKTVFHQLVEQPVRHVVRNAEAVFGFCEADRGVLNQAGILPKRLYFVPNGVNEFYLDLPGKEEKTAILQKLALDRSAATPPIAVFLGNHQKNKGIHEMFRAFERQGAPFTLVVAGGKRPNIDYDLIQRRCAKKGRIIFPGRLEDTELRALFHVADLFVFPTLSDTFPLSILEAMACGLPILSTRVGGIPYMVEPTNGHLVTAGDPVELRQAFDEMTSDRQRLASMGEESRRLVEQKYRWKLGGQSVYKAYQEILAA